MVSSDDKRLLRNKIQERLGLRKEYTDEEVQDVIDEVILECCNRLNCSVAERVQLKNELFCSLRRLDVLQIFVEDKEVSEVMINGTEKVFVEKYGKLQELDVNFDSEEKLNSVIQQIVSSCDRVVNRSSPIVDARLSEELKNNLLYIYIEISL